MSTPPFEVTARERVVLDEYTDCTAKRLSSPVALKQLIDEIVENLMAHPENTGDRLLRQTSKGDMWMRRRGNAYVFYQVTGNEPVSPLKVMLWFCGAFTEVNGRLQLDF